MPVDALIVEPGDRPEALNVIGTSVTVLADSRTTDGMGFTLQRGDEGAGPPPHCHPWDEAFFVLEGTIAFSVDSRSSLLGPGSLVYVPAGTTHAFNYGAGGGKMLEITGKGSNAAAFFRDFDHEKPGEHEIDKVVEIFTRHGAKLMI
jgi:mannose-6-phosphate isomerase-like protein (cupin superfamily)